MSSRTPLHFAHANGFPAPCYRKLWSHFDPSRYRIGAIDRIGHDARFPVTDGWPFLVEEQIAFIEAAYDWPVLGVGHSLGGFLLFRVAARRPELFQAVILLDAPLLGSFRGSALQFAKRIGLVDRVTPAGSTRNRQRAWPSAADALAHFRRKRLFQKFDPDCLADYIQYGTRRTAHGVELIFDPDIEYRIYRTIPHERLTLPLGLAVPAGFIGGRDSTMTRRMGLAATRTLMQVKITEGGHLFPFEVPTMAAQAIEDMSNRLRGI